MMLSATLRSRAPLAKPKKPPLGTSRGLVPRLKSAYPRISPQALLMIDSVTDPIIPTLR